MVVKAKILDDERDEISGEVEHRYDPRRKEIRQRARKDYMMFMRERRLQPSEETRKAFLEYSAQDGDKF
ncbi:hypothetical protein BNJ_00044 [Kaumoebavirus]|uniref:hypothetical protein n=1 Tax=Kaumoebavirus TaxID=1859492 RepID=UPI0009C3863F|nr:hypothetical protein BNJ_00044 [Kaumoebavirus]ARA71887.1 hypothetical protein BNJ_00044 [Kaumoebavirus]